MDRNGENNLIVVYFLLLSSVVEKFYHHIKLMSSTLHAILKFSSIFSYNNIAVLWWELVSSPALCSLSCWVGDTTTHGEEAAMSRAGQGNILIGPLPASLQGFVVGFIYHMVLWTFSCSWMWCIIVYSRFLKIFEKNLIDSFCQIFFATDKDRYIHVRIYFTNSRLFTSQQ